MIYSCFNEQAGRYDYFEDDRAIPMNGDLPVPSIQKLQAGSVGVPARDAGRPLPNSAKRAGSGWQARGMIVQCKSPSMRGLGELSSDGWYARVAIGMLAGGLVGAWVAGGGYRPERSAHGVDLNRSIGLIVGAALGGVVGYKLGGAD